MCLAGNVEVGDEADDDASVAFPLYVVYRAGKLVMKGSVWFVEPLRRKGSFPRANTMSELAVIMVDATLLMRQSSTSGTRLRDFTRPCSFQVSALLSHGPDCW